MTPTATRLKARLDQRQRWFANEWFYKWHFIGDDGPVTIDSFDGCNIHHGGIQFSGGARDLYWETLVRGVEKEIVEQFAWVDKEVRNYNRATALCAIDECAGQLISFVHVIRRRGVAKDRILRGNGREFPKENDAGWWENVSDAEILKQAQALKEALPETHGLEGPIPPSRASEGGTSSYRTTGVAVANWTDKDLHRLDVELAKKGVARHARAFHAAMEILGPEFSMGIGGNPQVNAIIADYNRLFRNSDRSWPGKGIGLVTSVDDVRKVTVPVVFGTCNIIVSEGLGFKNHEEFSRWCRYDAEIALKAAFAFADVFDLAYGRDEVANASPEAVEAWTLALSQLEMTTNALIGGFDLAALPQSICMTVELSLKAALMHRKRGA